MLQLLPCTQEAKNVVLSNYAVVELYYQKFDREVLEASAVVDGFSLAAMIGGTLGLCIGASIMTVFEWLEMLVFAILSIPFFYCGVQTSLLKREDSTKDDPLNALDEDAARVLKGFKRAYEMQEERKDSVLDHAKQSLVEGIDHDDNGLVDIQELSGRF
jgi:hypothetical protein